MRILFGSWGTTLADYDFACAVLGLGLIPAPIRNAANPRQMEQALTDLLSETSSDLLYWQLDVMPTIATSWAASLSAQRLTTIVRPALIQIRRVSILAEGAISGLTVWRYFVQNLPRPAPGALAPWTFFVSSPAPESRIGFRWPCRVGYIPMTPSETIAFSLQNIDYWSGNVFEVIPMTRRSSDCDLLVWGGIGHAQNIEELSARSMDLGGLNSELTVVFQPYDLTQELQEAQDLETLRHVTDSSGILQIPYAMGTEGQTLQQLIVGLSHNMHLDRAVAAVTGNDGLLMTDVRLIDFARLENRLLAEAQIMQQSARSGKSIRFDPETAGRLRIPEEMPSRREAGELIVERLKEYTWEGESHEASAFGRMSAMITKEEEVEATQKPRYLQTGIIEQNGDKNPVQGPLAKSTDYEIPVFIGERDPAYLSVKEAFPHLEPPEDGRAHRLTVTFWEPNLAQKPEVSHLDLPVVGDSTVCRFTVSTKADTTSFNARITVLHRNRVLQTGLLEATVGAAEGVPSFRIDAAPRTILGGLDKRLKFNTAFVLNDVAGHKSILAVSDDNAAVLNMSDSTVKGLVDVFNTAITKITEQPETFDGLRAKGSENLLRVMAQKGAGLHEYLMEHSYLGREYTSPTHVQLVAARPGTHLPIEFIYEFEAPEETAKLCPHAEQALQDIPGNDRCSNRCIAAPAGQAGSEQIDQEQIICPLAFWGLSCVIERRPHTPADNVIGGDFKLIPEPVGESERLLHPLESVLVGATKKANYHDPNATSNMFTRIQKVVSVAQQVSNWSKWAQAIEVRQPSLLTLVVHQEKDDYGTPMLDIGTPPLLKSDLVKKRHVRLDPEKARPIAILIGCETALADIEYESFAMRFHLRGAALVVSTVAKILGRQAAPVAAELIEEMSTIVEPKPFAEVLRDVRRRLLIKGTPMVMALTAYGDADWDIVGT